MRSFCLCVASALKEFSLLNSTLQGEEIRIFDEVNLGVATARDEGLIVPVVKKADKKTISGISAELRQLVEKTSWGELV